ncbi:MAG: selenocysteine-specific translation elongation factor [Thermodesulfobacteriota bacterium]
MKHIVLGTAGHIDHGKTTLIKALTGVDCDRLKEEKERGITIELGFAAMTLPSGISISIVDVPGHEKFVHHMVAGATGIDLVALVIAADEGIMPQTREHLDICKLLRVKKGLVALTKIDLVEKDWLELVREEIREFLQGTFLENSAIIPVSSITGEGITDFVREIDRLAQEVEERSPEGIFRLPIDRVFTMKGFGTVVTGTVVSGKVSIGDNLEILPSGLETKVRGIQIHGKPVEVATAGTRAGVNLQGLEKSAITRGEVLVQAQTLRATNALDAVFNLLPSAPKPLKNRNRVRLHVGTMEVLGRILILGAEEIKPGEEAYIRLLLEEPTIALAGDRFVMRSYSPVITIGGGEILDAFPTRYKRLSPNLKSELDILLKSSPEEKIKLHLWKAGPGGLSFNEMVMRLNLAPGELKSLVDLLSSKGEILTYDGDRLRYLHPQIMNELKESCLNFLREFHLQNPLQLGASKEELKSKLPAQMDSRLFQHLLSLLTREKKIVVEKDLLRLASHTISLKEEEKDLRQKIIKLLAKAALQPPTVKEIISELKVSPTDLKPVLQLLTREGILVRVKDDLYFHRPAIAELESKVIRFLQEQKEMSPAQFKEMTQVSRKYAIPLMEYLDAQKITLRVGDKRILRK